jgi:hypothetical protein
MRPGESLSGSFVFFSGNGVFIFDGVKGSCLGTAGLGRVRNWPAHMASLPISWVDSASVDWEWHGGKPVSSRCGLVL